MSARSNSARLRSAVLVAIPAAAVLAGSTLLAGSPALARTTGAAAPQARSAGHRAAMIAAVKPAPVVTDIAPAARSKQGLPAPLMSTAMQQANNRKQATALALLQMLARRLGPDTKCTSLACRAGLPVARDLAPTQEPQQYNYYCGPATVSEMLAQVGVTLSQQSAARELGTTGDGTDWSDASGYPVPRVLNENQDANSYVAVGLPWSPTSAQIRTFEVDLVADINDNGGVPLAGNAYEVAGGPHLVGNPVDLTIMHWIDIRGYQDYGAVTDYEDSVHNATTIGWGLDVPAYSSLATSTIVNVLGARGYDW
jgi:hypothetical protein